MVPNYLIADHVYSEQRTGSSRKEAVISKYSFLAEKSTAGERLSREDASLVLNSPDEDVLEVLASAYQVRRTFWGNKVHIHVLMNAKSGLCPEDCGYCSQSRVSSASIEKFPMVAERTLIDGAREAKAAKARRYCVVTSGRGASWREVNFLADTTRKIVSEVGIDVCMCVGLLDEDKARALKEAGVDQLNHNLNTSENFHPQVTTTHTYQDRIDTLKAARRAGLNLCTGAIFGMGESQDDVVDVLYALRDLEPQSIPVNFLNSIDGTPLEGIDYLKPNDCLRILSLTRFLNPKQEIRVSGGREVNLRSLQPLALYAANSVFTEGYLTTPGQTTKETWEMIEDLGFELEVDAEPSLHQLVEATT